MSASRSLTMVLLILSIISFSLLLSPVSVSAWNETPPCYISSSNPNDTVTNNYNSAGFTVNTAIIPGTFRLTPLTTTTYQTAWTLGLCLAAGSPGPGGIPISLGLYAADTTIAGKYNKLGQTIAEVLQQSEANYANCGTYLMTAGVFIAPGTYYVGISVGATGLLIPGNPSSLQPNVSYNYPTNGSLPNSITWNGQNPAPAYRAQITSCNATAPPSVRGDPLFTGFHGQVYQVHGIPDMIFNLISTKSIQLNSRFLLISLGEAMNAGQQRDAVYQSKVNRLLPKNTQHAVLPDTAPWTHTGTYLGETGLMLGTSRLYFKPGRFIAGIATITINGANIDMAAITTFPFTLYQEGPFSVTLISAHTVSVRSPLISFDLVNSDGFFNIDRAVLVNNALFHTTEKTSTDDEDVEPKPNVLIEGILGQSADATRYFPAYRPTGAGIIETWTKEVKQDFQTHQQMDYLVDESTREGLFSTHFNNNLFEDNSMDTDSEN